MRAILHLGTYKTGSSSIQNLMFDNRSWLQSHGILYPEVGLLKDRKIGFRHTGLIFNFLKSPRQVLPESLANEIAASRCDTLVFSSEAWSNPRHLSHLVQFASMLENIGVTQLSAVISFRNVSDYAQSHFREFTVNQSNSLDYKSYTKKPIGMFDYLLLSGVFRSIFGGSLTVMNFNEEGDVRRRFLEVSGLPSLEDFPTLPARANVKNLDALDVEGFRLCNYLGIPKVAAQDVVASCRPILEADQKITWTERFSEDFDKPVGAAIKRYSLLTGLPLSVAEAHLTPTIVSGRPVSDATELLEAELKRANTQILTS